MQPFADRFSPDIWDTIKRLAENTFQKAQDVFNQDDTAETEQWLDKAAGLEPLLARFRPKELGREEILGRIEDYRRDTIQKAHVRLEVLAWVRDRLKDQLDDDAIAEVKKKRDEYGLQNDPAVLALIEAAYKKIQDAVVYTPYGENPIPPIKMPESANTGLLFVARLDQVKGDRPAPASGLSTVFFAVARGVLYALDDSDGRVLWATRVGIDSESLPTRIPGGGLNEVVLVTVNDGSRSSISARSARTGEALWTQPLPAPSMGRPILVGKRVFVPTSEQHVKDLNQLRHDEHGVVLEIEIDGGFLLGKLARPAPGNGWCCSTWNGAAVPPR